MQPRPERCLRCRQLCEDLGAVLGDGDGVFDVGGAAAVGRAQGPAVRVVVVGVGAACDEHGLEGEDQPGAQHEAAVGAPFVGDVGCFVLSPGRCRARRGAP